MLVQYEDRNPDLTTTYPAFFRIYGDITRYRTPDALDDALVKALESLTTNRERRLAMTTLYDEWFRILPVRTLKRPTPQGLWRYPLLVSSKDRDALLEVLWENGILASRWYPSLVAMLSALAPGIAKQTVPGADQLAAEIINLPVDHDVDEETIARTAQIVQTYFRDKRLCARA
jgi:dTDP-4-amino-4,6-dideoxygalactose transaminase